MYFLIMVHQFVDSAKMQLEEEFLVTYFPLSRVSY